MAESPSIVTTLSRTASSSVTAALAYLYLSRRFNGLL